MKLYLAGPYVARDMIRGMAETFITEGHIVTSRWLMGTRELGTGTVGPSIASTDEEVRLHSKWDLEDILAAEALVHFNSSFLIELDPSLDNPTHQLGSGGRHVETGYAIAHGRPVIVIGEPENIFQRGMCNIVPGVPQALALLKG